MTHHRMKSHLMKPERFVRWQIARLPDERGTHTRHHWQQQ
ncbi:hypothetical protein N624_1548 [Levilactobacillus brevis]|nr:hypothetical protein N624_1548 [Levilactobacillus brevis]